MDIEATGTTGVAGTDRGVTGAPRVPALRLLQAVGFVATLDRFAMAPVFVVIAVDLDVSVAAVVGALSVYFLAYGLSQPVWGLISDRLGRVRTMRLALAMAGLLGLGSALVAGSLPVLAVLRGLTGAFFGA